MRWDRSSGRARNRTSRVPPWKQTLEHQAWAPGPSCMLWRCTALVPWQEHAHPIHRRPPGSVKLAACRVAVYLVM